MRKALVALSMTTVAFATSTAYLARELHLERSRPVLQQPVPPTASASPGPGPAPDTPRAETLKTATAAPATVATAVESSVTYEGGVSAQQREYLEEILARIADPQRREEMLVEYKMASRNANPRVAQALQLSSAEYDRLIELLAIGQINAVEYSARCTLDPQCNAHGNRQMPDSKEQEIANMLGPERQKKFNEYRSSMQERESVVQLRARLPDAAYLPEGQAEALISVLADERNRISADAMQGGVGLSGFGNGAGMAFITVKSDSPDERFESAQQNSQRLRARAAEVLTPEQLRIFNDMQDEVLLSTRQQVRQKQQYTAESTDVSQ